MGRARKRQEPEGGARRSRGTLALPSGNSWCWCGSWMNLHLSLEVIPRYPGWDPETAQPKRAQDSYVYLTWQIPCGPFSPCPWSLHCCRYKHSQATSSIQLESSSCLTQNMISPISSGLLMTMQWVGWSLCFQPVPEYLTFMHLSQLFRLQVCLSSLLLHCKLQVHKENHLSHTV